MWEVLAGLLVGTVVSGIVPLVNAELLVIGAVVAAPEIGIPLIAAVSTTGQMASKTLLFSLARWAPGRIRGKARAALDKASGAVAARGGAANSLVFASAVIGVPPFYGISLAAGALGMRMPSFVVSGAAGRLLRFGLIAWTARYVTGEAVETLATLFPAVGPVAG